ncbi:MULTISPECIES: VRR-NUC domain-containing protein [Burkholderia]|uniref:VRR-NUC domain-containing protein n=1 Tax=Burkholderia TaxID=32008 RepID=UPI000538C94E|nr:MULTISPECIES: VRR-NUC domain-containing protein [Burkholderia]KAA8764423.1 VRR-NUC domain-containing protein [Burkholderia pseudomallei]KGW58782.1 VRR-NUC domain protein [Burkholderia pseudomallei MSHR1357]KKC14894.1 VRR-NUC domain protein [Burkholderia pseudomallei MSHR1328]KVO85086.1 nuclease [Burkholderia ubonensis]ONA03729.1 nuclease [Burkholderia pseudomallei]
MSSYGSSNTPGGMTPKGTTTPVRLKPLTLDPVDKKIICKAICVCNRSPDKSESEAELKQQCVSRNLRDLDQDMAWMSPYKAEVNYNMANTPPTPVMRSATPLEPHPYLPGWLQKYWPGGIEEYPRGTMRRPDVVIVKDPVRPPTQDNIKNVVEIKFPPQKRDPEQEEDFRLIAGSREKLEVMGPQDCDCSEDDGDESPVKVAAEKLSELGRALRNLIGKGPPKIPGFGGLPPPSPVFVP